MVVAHSASLCPLCDADSEPLFEKHGHLIYQCTGCQHLFSLPAEPADHVTQVYSDAYFHGDAGGYADYLAEEPAQRQAARHLLRQVSRFASGVTLLDVGCAAGFLLDEFQQAGWQAHGVEPNATMADLAAKRCDGRVECAPVEQWRPTRRFDLITCVQVISHLVNPRAVVSSLIEHLEPAGLLLIETWDRGSWAARIAGRWWHEYNPPSVLHWFSRPSLEGLVTSSGPMLLRATGKPRKRISVGRSVSMLRHSSQSSAWIKLATAPLAVIPPSLEVPYPGDDAFWMLFQKAESI